MSFRFLLVFFHIWRLVVFEDFFDFLVNGCEALTAEFYKGFGFLQLRCERVHIHLSAFDAADDGFESRHGFGVGGHGRKLEIKNDKL